MEHFYLSYQPLLVAKEDFADDRVSPYASLETVPQFLEPSRYARRSPGVARQRGWLRGPRPMVRIEQFECVGALRGPRGRGVRQCKWSTAPTMNACTFNRRSVGVEIGGFASLGFYAPLLATCVCVRLFARSFTNSSPTCARRRRIGYCVAQGPRPCGQR